MSDCPICGTPSPTTDVLAPAARCECPACGLRFSPELDRARWPAAPVAAPGIEDIASVPQRRRESRRRLRWMAGFTGPGALLDVGCGSGSFLVEAAARGFEVIGVEASPALAGAAADLGVPVVPGRLEEVQLEAESADIICLWDVLDAVPDPVAVLRECHDVVRPGGWVFSELLDGDGLARVRQGGRWRTPSLDEHPLLLGRLAMKAALERAQLELISLSAVFDWEYRSWRERLTPRGLAEPAVRELLGVRGIRSRDVLRVAALRRG
jgi:SAM-dependent methyltransferase